MEPGSQPKNYFTRAEVAELFAVAPNTVSPVGADAENCRVSGLRADGGTIRSSRPA